MYLLISSIIFHRQNKIYFFFHRQKIATRNNIKEKGENMNKDKIIMSMLTAILTVSLMNTCFRLIDKYYERQFLIQLEQLQQEENNGISRNN